MLGLQSDFAMIFANEKRSAQEPYMFWLGKVQRLKLVGARSRVEYRQPIDLDNYDGKMVVIAHWYKAVQASSSADVDSVYVLKEPDHQCYDIAHILAPYAGVSQSTGC